jgi:hypothetical protein
MKNFHGKMRPILKSISMMGAAAVLALNITACDDAKEEGNNNAGLLLMLGSMLNGYTHVLTGNNASSVTIPANSKVLLRGACKFIAPAVLTIGAGTTIEADVATLSYLIIDTGAQLVAEGTALNPITFTTAKPAGTRSNMDWGGIIINGDADIIGTTRAGEGDSGNYGGSNDAHNGGTLKYVRVFFAGYPFTTDNELNGIAFQGCGSGTTVDYVQVHRGGDDGIEMFGGTFNAKHLVATDNTDDQLDVTQGYRGKIQFVVVGVPNVGEFMFEWDNKDGGGTEPNTTVDAYNITMVGNKNLTTLAGTDFKDKMTASLFNVYSVNVGGSAFYARSASTAIAIDYVIMERYGSTSTTDGVGTITITNSTATKTPATSLLDRNNFLTPATLAAAGAGAFEPVAGATNILTMASGATPPSDGFYDTSANYIGAVKDTAGNWLLGWTAFPAN